MTKRKGVRILKRQLVKLSVTGTNYTKSYIEILSYLSDILGKESLQYKLFQRTDVPDIRYQTFDDRIIVWKNQLESCIEVIKTKGVVNKSNFLSRISEGWLIFWVGITLSTVLPITYNVGYYYGQKSSVSLNSSTNITSQKSLQKELLNGQKSNR